MNLGLNPTTSTYYLHSLGSYYINPLPQFLHQSNEDSGFFQGIIVIMKHKTMLSS